MDIKRIDVKELKLVNKVSDIDYFDIRTTPMSMKIKNIIEEVKEEIIVIPSLQRDNMAWNNKKQSLFIDSILRNFPIPPIMTMNISNKTLVLDGQQRINALVNFRENGLKLNLNSDIKWQGKKYKDIDEELKWRFDQFVLQIQQVEQLSPKNEVGSISFEIFNRINSKSTPLTRMQIRYAAFYSDFIVFLKNKVAELSNGIVWKNETKEGIAEKILRFIAFYMIFKYEGTANEKNLTKQTNTSLDFNETIDLFLKNAAIGDEQYTKLAKMLIEYVTEFIESNGVENFYSKNSFGRDILKIQSTTLDALAYGIAKEKNINPSNFESLSKRINENNKYFGFIFYKDLFQQATTSKASVIKRFEFINENRINK